MNGFDFTTWAALIAMLCVVPARAWGAGEPAAAASRPAGDDFALLKSRLTESAREPNTYDKQRLLKVIADQKDDGSWGGIDYADATHSNWATNYHMVLVRHLASAFSDPQHPLCRDPRVLAAAMKAYDYWTAHDFRNPNWWWNEVATPEAFFKVMLMLGDKLSPEQKRAGLALCQRALAGDRTGQNLVWQAQVLIAVGALKGDAGMVSKGFRQIVKEVRLSTDDGSIQHDLSFNQHARKVGDRLCPQLYSGGYGRGFARSCAMFARLAAGTRWAWPDGKLTLLVRYILDGQQWMCRGRVFDYSTVGREISRRGIAAQAVSQACRDLAAIDAPRSNELKAFAERIERKRPAGDATAPAGNRYFWRTEFMAHHRRGWYASVRFASERVVGTERMNDENLKGAHLFDGVTYILRDGQEYVDIFPVWDWGRLPGITWFDGDQPWWPYMPTGLGTWAGGVSDGHVGMASYQLWKDATWHHRAGNGKPLRARKAWFFFDEEMVALGAGISCGLPDAPVFTSLNQCRLRGKVLVARADDPEPAEAARGRTALNRPRWVWHDRVGYVFPAACRATLKVDSQKGRWTDINKGLGKPGQVSLDVFSLWIEHGKGVRDGSYAYVVAPGVSGDRLSAYAARLPVTIVRNTAKMQAVWRKDGGVGMAAFYEPGQVKLGPLTLSVDQPCLLLVRQGDEALTLACSDPLARKLRVSVRVNVALDGKGIRREGDASVVTFSLPGDEAHAGMAVCRKVAVAR